MNNSFRRQYEVKGNHLIVNWYLFQKPFDFTAINIDDADDHDIEKLLLILVNDSDWIVRKQFPKIPVTLSATVKLSQSKLNMLKDHFQAVK